MRRQQTTPDWGAMIDDMLCRGLSLRDVGKSMGCEITTRMLHHYRVGVQPLHWRGEGLIALWCKTTGQQRGEAPTMELVRGHRVDRNRVEAGPRVESLPDWPAAKRGRKAREAA